MVTSAQYVMFCTVLLFSDDKGALRLEVCSMHIQDTAAVYLPCTFCSVLHCTLLMVCLELMHRYPRVKGLEAVKYSILNNSVFFINSVLRYQ